MNDSGLQVNNYTVASIVVYIHNSVKIWCGAVLQYWWKNKNASRFSHISQGCRSATKVTISKESFLMKETWTSMWSFSWKQNPLMSVNCSWMFVRHTAYPVLMEIISISGFFLILGKSSRAPPSRFPFSFFWPSRRTEWPWTQTQRHTKGLAQNVMPQAMNIDWCQRE